jgi:hypothetical protein
MVREEMTDGMANLIKKNIFCCKHFVDQFRLILWQLRWGVNQAIIHQIYYIRFLRV